MPDPLIIGNWKMNGSRDSVASLVRDLVIGLDSCKTEVVICPPVVFMADVAGCINGTVIRLGAQNICEFDDGAYTGEVSGPMLREFDCRYVIIGHSERRQMYGESDEQVANKLVAAQQSGLQAIVCVGETGTERDRGETTQVVNRQLGTIIDKVGLPSLASAVIAYEPIWAIGTGQVATAEMAQQVLSEIRTHLGALGETTQLLYGGSVTAQNAKELFEQDDIDGALVGGASLQADQFIGICKVAGLD
ncbi:MAG: triose-phosphate isomerase [Cellvibrionales bacterium]|nr:MAG: triose-phosphate isomerase [Cellvibrionales bacterium]